MKGVVFTEFVDLVEQKFSLDLVDEIIEESDLASEGAYTSVGTYSHQEMIQMVAKLSKKTNIPETELLIIFGKYLIERFKVNYPELFDTDDLFAFLASVHNHVHVEVKKLYPDAELPTISVVVEQQQNSMSIEYQSPRPFADLAYGLILGAVDHFAEKVELTRENRSDKYGETFLLKKL